MTAIEIHNLTKNYGKSRGITNIQLQVEAGECFGFIGPNGAGKSTTIRTMLGFIKPTSGKAFVLEKDCESESVQIKQCTGYLPSEAFFYPHMKVKDMLALSQKIRGLDCRTEATHLSNRLNLDLHKRVRELSFGNRKKLGIILALQHNPKVLILDEPTSGLDPLMQKEFFEIIRERNRQGVTVFLSSHILSEIQHNCTRAAIIRDGKIIACDSVENLSKNNAKRVCIHYATENDIAHSLAHFDGVKDYAVSASYVQTFLYTGNIDVLVKQLAIVNLQDITIQEPDLEEVFMHYYE